MNNTKKIGRPKVFNDTQVLEKALNVFWSKGYDGASMKDLTGAMGINAPSLYATFGDKKNLFLKTVDHYMHSGSCSPLEVFEQETDIRQAVIAFFQEVIRLSTQGEQGTQGCFLSACVATSVETVEGASQQLQTGIEESQKRIAKRFELAKQEAQLPADFPSEQRARLMFDLRQGPVFRARAGTSADDLKQDINAWVDCILP
ncbi:TetR/AcrR family transcriptional regulator [Marinomonas epiphytica]